MATRNAKIKSIKPYPPKKDGSKSIGITFDDDKFGFYGFSGDHGLKTDVLYSYVYEDKVSAKGNAYQDISKIEEWKAPKEVDPPKKEEALTSETPKLGCKISPELRAELKTRIVIAVNDRVMESFLKDKFTDNYITELDIRIANALISAIDELQE